LQLVALGGGGALLAACNPGASPSSTAPSGQNVAHSPATAAPAPPTAAPAPTSAADNWDAIVTAAREEASVAVTTYSGSGYRDVMTAFQEAYPGISVEHTQFQSSSRDFVPRLLQELKAGLHSWDVAIMPTPEMLRQVRPAGGMDPIRPVIVRPEVLDDAVWRNGFVGGFNDSADQWAYAIARYRETQLWVNTDMVQEGEIKSITDLLQPKWKGQILGGDPRTKGSGFLPATAMRLKTGDDDIIRKFYKDQEVALSKDARQMTDFMVRGRYPIGLGAIDRVILADFRDQGLGQNLHWVSVPEIDYLNSGASGVFLMAERPHPQAAQVFINWLLTKDAARVYSQNVKVNSRRTDVPPYDPEVVPVDGVDYIRIDQEEILPEIEKTQDIANEVLN
jgi:iron(III) transport system substrate-binding protein